ncbi:unnamed protein product [Caenorhabditis nigoni]
MKTFAGGIRIENAKLAEMSIFQTDINFQCGAYGFFIKNNSYLYDATMLLNMNLQSGSKNKECVLFIENNPELDMDELCSNGNLLDLVEIRTKGNFRNCGCQGDEITTTSLPGYNNCTTSYNGLKLSNTTINNTDLSALSNIATIRGSIDIESTNLQDLSFLSSWRTWKLKGDMVVQLNLRNNTQMTKIGVSRNLYNIRNIQSLDEELHINFANFENLHPDFCISISEFIIFFENRFVFNNLHANLCEVDGDIEGKLLCRFTSMYDLPNNCDIIVGNVTIRRGDEEYVIKFVDVKYLFGSLTIVNTTLETLEYAGVPYVAVLDEPRTRNPNSARGQKMMVSGSSPAYQIIGNKKLKDAALSIVQIVTNGPRYAIYQDNNPKIFDGKECEINDWWRKDAKKRDILMLDLNFTGADCDGVIIRNNRKLINAGALEKLVSFIDEDLNDCKFQITNNPILDLQNLCDGYALAYLVDFETYGNLQNCGCQGNAIYPSTLLGFQNCTYFYNGLRLYNFSDTPDLKSLSKIGTIYGNIDIQNSNLQNLSFLENFQYSTVFSKNEEVVFNIQNNPNMTRLDLPALKNMDNSNSNAVKIANFENLHPDFCLTISEFWLFYELEVSFKNLHAKLCEYSEAEVTEIEDEELCIFESLDKLPDACKTIVGNILIESGDEKNAEKLMFVGSLFGSLTIRDTNLADLKFLSKLNFIVFLDGGSSIRPF